MRSNSLTSDFKAGHSGQGFSFTGAEINQARDAVNRVFNQ